MLRQGTRRTRILHLMAKERELGKAKVEDRLSNLRLRRNTTMHRRAGRQSIGNKVKVRKAKHRRDNSRCVFDLRIGVLPVLDKKTVAPGIKGVVEVLNHEISDFWRMLERSSEKLVLITSQKCEEAGGGSKEFNCQSLTSEGRVIPRKKRYTNLGCVKVSPSHLVAENETPVCMIKNDTGEKWYFIV